jgi:hypothetical protein
VTAEDIVHACVVLRLSYRQVCAKLGIGDPGQVGAVRHAAGIRPRAGVRPRADLDGAAAACQAGVPSREIGELFGCHPDTVLRHARAAGLPVRPPGRRQASPSGMADRALTWTWTP